VRVLLTDGLQRKTLVATRSLGRAGYEVWVADDRRASLARSSRYCRRALVSPHPADPAYGGWLRSAAADVDLVLPMDDLSTAAAIACGEDLGAAALLPSAEQFAVCRDKGRTMALAAAADVPHPRTETVDGPSDLARARSAIPGAAVLRPRVGSGGRGVRFLEPGEEPPGGDLAGRILQERLPQGRKVDVGLLFDGTGALRAQFCQEELRWFPGVSGTSTLQRSAWCPDLLALSLRLLRPIGWRGLAEVEWLVALDGSPWLLEVNPRPWASIGLAVAAGVDFPRLWAELALGGDTRGPDAYDLDVLCRWSLPADLLHLLGHPLRSLGAEAPRRRPGERVVDDVLDREDPGPLFGFAWAVLGHLFDVGAWRQVMRW